MYFDIGANVGKWALANIKSCDKIIAIEASPTTFKRLVNECNHPNITPLNFAVCNNNNEDVVFYNASADTLSTINKDWLTSTGSRFCNQPFTQIVCKSITIDKLIEVYGPSTLIKIDVEGGEYECVSSLTQKVDLLCFEWAAELNTITVKCIDHLYSIGFREFYIQSSDSYTFRPDTYYDIQTLKSKLNTMKPKIDWGMIWCK